MTSLNVLDLVSFASRDMVVVGHDADRPFATELDWPLEFNEIDDHERPDLVELDGPVTLLQDARSRIDAFNDLLLAYGRHADEREGWDWDEVNELLEKASRLLPRALVGIDLGDDDVEWTHEEPWMLSEDVPPEMRPLVRPAAIILHTHATGRGEADVSALSEAYEAVQALATPLATPAR